MNTGSGLHGTEDWIPHLQTFYRTRCSTVCNFWQILSHIKTKQ